MAEVVVAVMVVHGGWGVQALRCRVSAPLPLPPPPTHTATPTPAAPLRPLAHPPTGTPSQHTATHCTPPTGHAPHTTLLPRQGNLPTSQPLVRLAKWGRLRVPAVIPILACCCMPPKGKHKPTHPAMPMLLSLLCRCPLKRCSAAFKSHTYIHHTRQQRSVVAVRRWQCRGSGQLPPRSFGPACIGGKRGPRRRLAAATAAQRSHPRGMSVTYGLKYLARVLVAQTSDAVNSKWLVGTTALREENEVRFGA